MTRPDQVWVTDVTYLKVNGAWRYLATVMDRHTAAARLGVGRRRRRSRAPRVAASDSPAPSAAGPIVHSDRGVEFLAERRKQTLQRAGSCRA